MYYIDQQYKHWYHEWDSAGTPRNNTPFTIERKGTDIDINSLSFSSKGVYYIENSWYSSNRIKIIQREDSGDMVINEKTMKIFKKYFFKRNLIGMIYNNEIWIQFIEDQNSIQRIFLEREIVCFENTEIVEQDGYKNLNILLEHGDDFQIAIVQIADPDERYYRSQVSSFERVIDRGEVGGSNPKQFYLIKMKKIDEKFIECAVFIGRQGYYFIQLDQANQSQSF